MAESAAVAFGWERTALAVEKVKDRLRRTSSALAQASVPYAVVGENALAEWVGRADKAAVRTTQDVGIMIRRDDFEAAKPALEAVGFVHCQVLDVDMFLDGPNGRPKDAVQIRFAGEKLKAEYTTPSPDISESEPAAQFQVVSLDALVRMKLNSYRLKDRVHLMDLIGVGLVDQTWATRLPTELASRLQHLLDNPDG